MRLKKKKNADSLGYVAVIIYCDLVGTKELKYDLWVTGHIVGREDGFHVLLF